MVKRDSTEFFAERAAVDTQSAKAHSGGYTWKPKNPQTRSILIWDTCPPMKPITDAMRRCETFRDFTGHRIGKLVVLGILASRTAEPASWVVRCDCGMFETRKSKAIRTFDGRTGWCGACDKVWRLKQQDRARALGRWPDGRPYVDNGTPLKFTTLT